MRSSFALAAVLGGLIVLAGCQTTDMSDDHMMSDMSMETTEFVVTIEVLTTSPTPIAPLAWAVHAGENPFVAGEMGKLGGLEALAEDGNPSGAAASLGAIDRVSSHGVVSETDGTMESGPAAPGDSYTFTVTAYDGQALSFATMYVQSNDLFFSPDRYGLPLFDMAAPAMGNVTESVLLYDAGTEVNERPGTGPNQAPRQSGPNTGATENNPVKVIGETMDGFTYPNADAVVRVTVEPRNTMM
jgi:hypothetical protein